jgi:hypothetical protein
MNRFASFPDSSFAITAVLRRLLSTPNLKLVEVVLFKLFMAKIPRVLWTELHFQLLTTLVEMRLKKIYKLHERENFELSKMRSIKLKLTSIASFLSSKKVIWCRFIFERSVSREDNLLSSSLELMDHSKLSNALVKMPTRLNYQLSMRFQKH